MRPLDVAASSSPSSPDVPAQPAPQPARPDTALAAALARLARRYDLRQLRRQAGDDADTAPVAVVEHAFCCATTRPELLRLVREAWQRLAFAALGQEQAAVALLPVDVGDVDAGHARAWLWPAPASLVAARRETIAGLGRAAGVPAGVWEAASGAVGDGAVPPGVVRLLLPANLKVELSDAAAHETAAKAEAPEPWAATQLTVAALDLVEGPRGAFGRARALAACWPWLEQLIETAGLGAAWQWADARDGGDGAAGTEGRHDRERERGRGRAPLLTAAEKRAVLAAVVQKAMHELAPLNQLSLDLAADLLDEACGKGALRTAIGTVPLPAPVSDHALDPDANRRRRRERLRQWLRDIGLPRWQAARAALASDTPQAP